MKWDDEALEYAQEHELALCKIIIDGSCKVPTTGTFKYEGPLPTRCSDQLWELFTTWLQEGFIG